MVNFLFHWSSWSTSHRLGWEILISGYFNHFFIFQYFLWCSYMIWERLLWVNTLFLYLQKWFGNEMMSLRYQNTADVFMLNYILIKPFSKKENFRFHEFFFIYESWYTLVTRAYNNICCESYSLLKLFEYTSYELQYPKFCVPLNSLRDIPYVNKIYSAKKKNSIFPCI